MFRFCLRTFEHLSQEDTRANAEQYALRVARSNILRALQKMTWETRDESPALLEVSILTYRILKHERRLRLRLFEKMGRAYWVFLRSLIRHKMTKDREQYARNVEAARGWWSYIQRPPLSRFVASAAGIEQEPEAPQQELMLRAAQDGALSAEVREEFAAMLRWDRGLHGLQDLATITQFTRR